MVLDLQGSYVACLYSGDGGFFSGLGVGAEIVEQPYTPKRVLFLATVLITTLN